MQETTDHQPLVTQEIIQQVADTIARTKHPDLIVVFGSCSRRDSRWDSDLDLFVVMQTDLPPLERSLDIRRLFERAPCPMDVIVYTPAELDYWKDVPSSFAHQALTQGMILYERATEDAGATVDRPG